jgi:hypothetical protein
MNKEFTWGLLIILLVATIGSLWIVNNYYTLSEKSAWLDCVKTYDFASSEYQQCRGLYPKIYKLLYPSTGVTPQNPLGI